MPHKSFSMRAKTIFTSIFKVIGPDYFENDIMNLTNVVAGYIDRTYNIFNPDSMVSRKMEVPKPCIDSILDKKILEYNQTAGTSILDYTCCLKGLFLDNLLFEYGDVPDFDYLFDFGGDIVGQGEFTIPIGNSFAQIKTLPGDIFGIFTSGNNEKRGNHIKCTDETDSSLTQYFTGNSEYPLWANMDAYATLRYAGMCDKLYNNIEIKVNSGVATIT